MASAADTRPARLVGLTRREPPITTSIRALVASASSFTSLGVDTDALQSSLSRLITLLSHDQEKSAFTELFLNLATRCQDTAPLIFAALRRWSEESDEESPLAPANLAPLVKSLLDNHHYRTAFSAAALISHTFFSRAYRVDSPTSPRSIIQRAAVAALLNPNLPESAELLQSCNLTPLGATLRRVHLDLGALTGLDLLVLEKRMETPSRLYSDVTHSSPPRLGAAWRSNAWDAARSELLVRAGSDMPPAATHQALLLLSRAAMVDSEGLTLVGCPDVSGQRLNVASRNAFKRASTRSFQSLRSAAMFYSPLSSLQEYLSYAQRLSPRLTGLCKRELNNEGIAVTLDDAIEMGVADWYPYSPPGYDPVFDSDLDYEAIHPNASADTVYSPFCYIPSVDKMCVAAATGAADDELGTLCSPLSLHLPIPLAPRFPNYHDPRHLAGVAVVGTLGAAHGERAVGLGCSFAALKTLTQMWRASPRAQASADEDVERTVPCRESGHNETILRRAAMPAFRAALGYDSDLESLKFAFEWALTAVPPEGQLFFALNVFSRGAVGLARMALPQVGSLRECDIPESLYALAHAREVFFNEERRLAARNAMTSHSAGSESAPSTPHSDPLLVAAATAQASISSSALVQLCANAKSANSHTALFPISAAKTDIEGIKTLSHFGLAFPHGSTWLDVIDGQDPSTPISGAGLVPWFDGSPASRIAAATDSQACLQELQCTVLTNANCTNCSETCATLAPSCLACGNENGVEFNCGQRHADTSPHIAAGVMFLKDVMEHVLQWGTAHRTFKNSTGIVKCLNLKLCVNPSLCEPFVMTRYHSLCGPRHESNTAAKNHTVSGASADELAEWCSRVIMAIMARYTVPHDSQDIQARDSPTVNSFWSGTVDRRWKLSQDSKSSLDVQVQSFLSSCWEKVLCVMSCVQRSQDRRKKCRAARTAATMLLMLYTSSCVEGAICVGSEGMKNTTTPCFVFDINNLLPPSLASLFSFVKRHITSSSQGQCLAGLLFNSHICHELRVMLLSGSAAASARAIATHVILQRRCMCKNVSHIFVS